MRRKPDPSKQLIRDPHQHKSRTVCCQRATPPPTPDHSKDFSDNFLSTKLRWTAPSVTISVGSDDIEWPWKAGRRGPF